MSQWLDELSRSGAVVVPAVAARTHPSVLYGVPAVELVTQTGFTLLTPAGARLPDLLPSRSDHMTANPPENASFKYVVMPMRI